jgi:hypothetical protein
MDPLAQSSAYRKRCGIYRTGHVVRSVESGNAVFDGSAKLLESQKDTGGTGINAAKKFVRKSGQLSYTT